MKSVDNKTYRYFFYQNFNIYGYLCQQQFRTSVRAVFAGMITEDVLLLINERNKDSKKPVNAECTLMVQPDGVRLIIRDSGVIFDITNEKAKADSYRQCDTNKLYFYFNIY